MEIERSRGLQNISMEMRLTCVTYFTQLCHFGLHHKDVNILTAMVYVSFFPPPKNYLLWHGIRVVHLNRVHPNPAATPDRPHWQSVACWYMYIM